MTNRILLKYNDELQALGNSIVVYLLQSKVKDFYRNNGVRIKSVYDRIRNIQKEYFVFVKDEKSEDGENIKFEGTGKDAKPVLLEEKKLEDYENQLNILLDRQIEIIV